MGYGMGVRLIAHLTRDSESTVTQVRVLLTLANGFGQKSRVKSDHEYDIAGPQLSADDEIQQFDQNRSLPL